MRIDGRMAEDLRKVTIETGVLKHADGSAMIKFGDTHVLCAATIEDYVPPFLKNSGQGWITAEYGMLPCATGQRSAREAARGKQDGRTLEIQRLIGRSMRAVAHLDRFGERTIRIDCDVIQADGGTRTASITGAYVALVLAFRKLVAKNATSTVPTFRQVSAVSVGVVGGVPVLDLCYEEDSKALVDLNVVMSEGGELVEIQGTGEDRPFTRAQLNQMLDLAEKGAASLIEIQKAALRSA